MAARRLLAQAAAQHAALSDSSWALAFGSRAAAASTREPAAAQLPMRQLLQEGVTVSWDPAAGKAATSTGGSSVSVAAVAIPVAIGVVVALVAGLIVVLFCRKRQKLQRTAASAPPSVPQKEPALAVPSAGEGASASSSGERSPPADSFRVGAQHFTGGGTAERQMSTDALAHPAAFDRGSIDTLTLPVALCRGSMEALDPDQAAYSRSSLDALAHPAAYDRGSIDELSTPATSFRASSGVMPPATRGSIDALNHPAASLRSSFGSRIHSGSSWRGSLEVSRAYPPGPRGSIDATNHSHTDLRYSLDGSTRPITPPDSLGRASSGNLRKVFNPRRISGERARLLARLQEAMRNKEKAAAPPDGLTRSPTRSPAGAAVVSAAALEANGPGGATSAAMTAAAAAAAREARIAAELDSVAVYLQRELPEGAVYQEQYLLGPRRRLHGALLVDALQVGAPLSNVAVKFYAERAAFLADKALYEHPAAAELNLPGLFGLFAGAPPACPPAAVLERPGATLAEWLADAPSWAQRVQAVYAAGRALGALHRQRLVHGSLVPGSLAWFPSSSCWKLLGMPAWAQEGQMVPLHSAPLRYAPPEAVATASAAAAGGLAANAAVAGDVWAFGVVAFEVLTSEALFPAALADTHVAGVLLAASTDGSSSGSPGARLRSIESWIDQVIAGPAAAAWASLPANAMGLLRATLQRDPRRRPALEQVLAMPFFSNVAQPGSLRALHSAVSTTPGGSGASPYVAAGARQSGSSLPDRPLTPDHPPMSQWASPNRQIGSAVASPGTPAAGLRLPPRLPPARELWSRESRECDSRAGLLSSCHSLDGALALLQSVDAEEALPNAAAASSARHHRVHSSSELAMPDGWEAVDLGGCGAGGAAAPTDSRALRSAPHAPARRSWSGREGRAVPPRPPSRALAGSAASGGLWSRERLLAAPADAPCPALLTG